LGTWYETARLPNSFEKNLDYVTATYTLRDDGKINVLNKGFDSTKNDWKEAKGKAWVPDSRIPAHLKVSFFWIFAGDYKIIALDQENYSYSMVTSKTKKYLWILSRTPHMDVEVYNQLVDKAKGFGFEVEDLYKVLQS
jgi:lipocalin